MATKSFDEMLVIDTPEAAANLEEAFWRGEARRALNFEGSLLETMQKTHEFLEKNPEWLKEFIANAKEEMRLERLSTTEEERELDRRCFYDSPLVIDTPEAAANLEAAFREAMERGPLKFEGPSIDEVLESGREFLRNNPGYLDRLVEKVKERARQNGEDLNQMVTFI